MLKLAAHAGPRPATPPFSSGTPLSEPSVRPDSSRRPPAAQGLRIRIPPPSRSAIVLLDPTPTAAGPMAPPAVRPPARPSPVTSPPPLVRYVRRGPALGAPPPVLAPAPPGFLLRAARARGENLALAAFQRHGVAWWNWDLTNSAGRRDFAAAMLQAGSHLETAARAELLEAVVRLNGPSRRAVVLGDLGAELSACALPVAACTTIGNAIEQATD